MRLRVFEPRDGAVAETAHHRHQRVEVLQLQQLLSTEEEEETSGREGKDSRGMCWTWTRGNFRGLRNQRQEDKGQKIFTAEQTEKDARGAGKKKPEAQPKETLGTVFNNLHLHNKSNLSLVLDVPTCAVSNESALVVNGNPQGSTLPFSLCAVSLEINGLAAVWEGCRGGNHLILLAHPLE